MTQIEKIEHEIMLPLIEALEKATEDLRKLVQVNQAPAGEPKPAQKLVDWSCPLLKGCNTKCGELMDRALAGEVWIASNIWDKVECKYLRLAPPTTPTSNWQVYHQGETNLQTLHDAGFVVQIHHVEVNTLFTSMYELGRSYLLIVHYRVSGIREGFTDVPESAT